MISFSTVCGINGTFYIKFEHNLGIVKINEHLVVKNLLTKFSKTNEHSNVTTFVHALIHMHACMHTHRHTDKYLRRDMLRSFPWCLIIMIVTQ